MALFALAFDGGAVYILSMRFLRQSLSHFSLRRPQAEEDCRLKITLLDAVSQQTASLQQALETMLL